MIGAEILLLVIGVVFYIASFFITEKLGPGELNKIGELSNGEIQRIMERELLKVTAEIEGRVEEKAEEALAKSERSMEKECNEKIMAISEYSDTIVESMNKTHNEIMFLYSMLNDKHAELTDFSAKLQGLAKDLKKKDEEISSHLARKIVPEEVNETFVPMKDEPVAASQPEPVQEMLAEERQEETGKFPVQKEESPFAVEVLPPSVQQENRRTENRTAPPISASVLANGKSVDQLLKRTAPNSGVSQAAEPYMVGKPQERIIPGTETPAMEAETSEEKQPFF